jgi:hypothetical protein
MFSELLSKPTQETVSGQDKKSKKETCPGAGLFNRWFLTAADRYTKQPAGFKS